jgi:hypothetical protein
MATPINISATSNKQVNRSGWRQLIAWEQDNNGHYVTALRSFGA